MPSDIFDEMADMLFAVAMAAAIGLGATNLAIQVNKERAAFDAAAATPKLSHLAPPRSPDAWTTEVDKTSPTGLNF